MVDLVITPASVIADSKSQREGGTAGEALAAGQLVTNKDPASAGKYMLADTNHATVERRQPTGIALHAAALNQPIAVLTHGDITIGAALTAGTAYYASDTAGGICPVADVGAGEKVTQVGLAKSTTVLAVDFQYPGVTL